MRELEGSDWEGFYKLLLNVSRLISLPLTQNDSKTLQEGLQLEEDITSWFEIGPAEGHCLSMSMLLWAGTY